MQDQTNAKASLNERCKTSMTPQGFGLFAFQTVSIEPDCCFDCSAFRKVIAHSQRLGMS